MIAALREASHSRFPHRSLLRRGAPHELEVAVMQLEVAVIYLQFAQIILYFNAHQDCPGDGGALPLLRSLRLPRAHGLLLVRRGVCGAASERHAGIFYLVRSLGRPPDVATIVVTRVVVYIPRSADGPPVGPARTAQGKSWWGTADGVPHLPRPAQWQGGLSVPPLGARAASRFPSSRGGWAG